MEREEGELTDEDLEDVSDNSSISIVPLIMSGKSSPLSAGREPFRELSLTSVSEDSEERQPINDPSRNKCTLLRTRRGDINHELRRRRYKYRDEPYVGTKRLRRISDKRVVRRRSNAIRRDYSSLSSSSGNSDHYNKKILRQLRDAVRINKSENLPNCSLRTRLKRMIEPDSQGSKNSDDDPELEVLRDQALQSKGRNESPVPDSTKDNATSVADEDLIELRLIALQSAVLKKHQNRRKKKEEEQKQIVNQVETEKNATNQQEREKCSSENPDSVDKTPQSEDKEKRNENVESNNNNAKDGVTAESMKSTIEDDEDILRAMLLTSISRKISNKKLSRQGTASPKLNQVMIDPLRRRANEFRTITQLSSALPVNRLIINVNSDSESDCDETVIDKKEPKKGTGNKGDDLFNKSLSLFLQQARARSEKDYQSDISKHLPRSQQLEYKRLKRKLQLMSARIKPGSKMRKSFSVSDENRRLKLNNTVLKRSLSKGKIGNSPPANGPVTQPANNITGVKKSGSINNRRFNKTDRLYVKGKYEELSPLMVRVSEARNARDKSQTEVKRLINDLRKARTELTTTHQTYTVLMQQLVKAKSCIDERLNGDELKNRKLNKTNIMCTSTPNKVILKEIPCDLSTIEHTNTTQAEKLQNPIVPDTNQEKDNTLEDKPVEMMEIVESVPVTDNEKVKEATILHYSSPLDHMQLNRDGDPSNPLTVLCPYDLLGVCRDADCVYRHCGNAITD